MPANGGLVHDVSSLCITISCRVSDAKYCTLPGLHMQIDAKICEVLYQLNQPGSQSAEGQLRPAETAGGMILRGWRNVVAS